MKKESTSPADKVLVNLAKSKMVYFREQGCTKAAAMNHAIRFLIANGMAAEKARQIMEKP